MQWAPCDLDDFVRRSDALGGPGSRGCQDFWNGFSVVPSHQVDTTLDPLSDRYVAEQMALYTELSGRTYEPNAHEQTNFDLERHVAATNPYDHPNPADLAMHIQRLSRAFRMGRAARGETVLDMGCGWGLSSELAAYLGLKVVAVDINSSFVSLISQRSERSGADITAVQSTFDAYVPATPVDLVLFYESLHHAVRPWTVVSRAANALNPGGRVILAGEPVNDIWWRHWGLRLDAISVYCIRKFGWFESGWSLPFIKRLMFRAGLAPVAMRDADPEIDVVIVGTKGVCRLSGAEAIDLFETSGCVADLESAILTGDGSLSLSFPAGSTRALLEVVNYRSKVLRVRLACNGADLHNGDLRSGPTEFRVARDADTFDISFAVEEWIADEELNNGDTRTIGLHLLGLTFAP